MKMLEKRNCNCLRATASSGLPWLPAFALVVLIAVIAVIAVPERAAAYDACDTDDRCVHEDMAGYAYDVYKENGGTALNTGSEDAKYYFRSGAGDEDVLDHIFGWPYSLGRVTLTHFWNADNGKNDGSSVGNFGTFPNSWNKVSQYWRLALGAYAREDHQGAIEFLGHTLRTK